MCGICGTAGYGGQDLLNRMIARIQHRGPDSNGFFTSAVPKSGWWGFAALNTS